MSWQRATEAIAAARAERDAIRGPYRIAGLAFDRRLRLERIARNPQRPRIRRIERTAFNRRRVLRAPRRERRTRIMRSPGPTFRTKHVGSARTIDQRIAARSVGNGNGKRTSKRGGGRKTERMIHRDPNQVTCIEKKRQITGWRLGDVWVSKRP
ncbi:hypothetical protein [Burkholderia diffusa]|uniref:hypothetical protein n=1 Tax=Burkholderia diffusa TaxID=488732 RepID=UPI0014796116|nr:hypothetical protein [Burkholderia diffusa]MBM2653250.1 hypothetical protein [Burkholderia diffusa]